MKFTVHSQRADGLTTVELADKAAQESTAVQLGITTPTPVVLDLRPGAPRVMLLTDRLSPFPTWQIQVDPDGQQWLTRVKA